MLSDRMAPAHHAAKRLSDLMAVRTLAILALLLSLSVLGADIAKGASSSAGLRQTQAAGSSNAGRVNIVTPALKFGQADFHADTWHYDMSVSITQMSNDCGVALAGSYCLRYSIETVDEIPLHVGYGLIPASDVTVSGATIKLSVDTRAISGMRNVVGTGGVITLVWTGVSSSPASTIRHETTQLRMASVQGTVLGHGVPAQDVAAALLYFASA